MHVETGSVHLHTYYVDEKAIQKGHVYLSTFLDQNRNVVFVAEGNDSGSVGRFRDHLESKNGKAEDVKHISSDMGSGYLKGAKTYFPNAKVTLDHFHVMQHMTEAVNDVRRREYAALVDEQDEERRMLKGQRYLFLKNYKNLDEGRKQALKGLMDTFHDLGRIYVFKEGMRGIWGMSNKHDGQEFLQKWCTEARIEGIPELDKVVDMFGNELLEDYESLEGFLGLSFHLLISRPCIIRSLLLPRSIPSKR